jgi:hypothetical protein
MNIECIAEFIIILNNELKNAITIDEINEIEKSYKSLYIKFIKELNDDDTIKQENRIIALDLFESSNLFFETMIIGKRYSLKSK